MESLQAAGATVHDFKEFGDYQGSWYAFVTYQGKMGIVGGSYGSCSGCDAFQGEFDYSYEDTPDNKEKLSKFGEGYLKDFISKEQVLKEQTERSMWDEEAEKIIKWIDGLHRWEFNEKFEKVINEESN